MSKVSVRNLSDEESYKIAIKIVDLFKKVYKRIPGKKILFDRLHVKFPDEKTKIYNMSDYKNMRKIFSYLLANIDNKAFTQARANPYAFDLLWIILETLERHRKLRRGEMSPENIENYIKYGKYVFYIPKKYRYTFDVKGDELATLKIT